MTFPLPPTSAFLGTSLLGLGILRLVAPQPAYKLFGLPLAPSEQPSPFIYSIAGRDLALGVAYILLGLKGNRTGVWGLVVGTVVAAQVDAYTTFRYGGHEFGGWRGKWLGHSLGGLILGVVAWKGWGF